MVTDTLTQVETMTISPPPEHRLTLVTCGLNRWDQYTLPFIRSVRMYEPDIPVIVVDNGSEPPYPDTPLATVMTYNKRGVMPATNYGMDQVLTDWMLVTDNDMLCTGAFSHLVEFMDERTIYSCGYMRQDEHEYPSMTAWFISREAADMIGGFDEGYIQSGEFGDIDYCIRARQQGIIDRLMTMPFTHFAGGTRFGVSDHAEVRMKNANRFLRHHGYMPIDFRCSRGWL